MSIPQNAIVRRLGSLARDWGRFSKNESAFTCIWSVKADEVEMIDAFYELEITEHGRTSDIFLKFSSPYTNHDEYTKALIEELNEIIIASKDQITEVGLDPNELNLGKNASQPVMFLRNLEAFSQLLNIEGNVVAYLSPQENTNIPAWVDWLMKINAAKLKNVKIMLHQLDEKPVFDPLINNFRRGCHKIIPELKMEEAITELAAQGNPHDPGTKFRKIYVAMMQAATKSNLPEAERLANEALKLTRKNGLKLLEATVFLVLGGLYLNKKKKKEALQSYDEAIMVLEKEKREPEIAKQQLAMAYLSKGMALLQMKKYDMAALTYESAAKAAQEASNDFLEMDSWRMAGTCHLRTTLRKTGEDCLRKSLQVGMKLDDKMRRDTTMPFTAMELYQLETRERRVKFDEAMISVIGEDWQELGSIKKRAKQKVKINA